MLHRFGGSPIGNSRVKLTNTADCVKKGLIQEGQDALQVAAEQLSADGVDVLHTIGGDDTNTTAADLAAYLEAHDYGLTVVGLPKTIDNDIVPVRQSLGAITAAQQASLFARNVLAEHGSNPRMLVVHEVMGRACGWLTAAAARDYMAWHAEQEWVPAIGLSPQRWAVHAVYVPEVKVDLAAESARLRAVMDEVGCVNIFLSEGAGVSDIVAELEASGAEVQRDPFGHVKLDTINPGAWFAQVVRRAARGAQDDGAEVRLLLPLGGGRARGPRPDQGDDRPGRRLRPGTDAGTGRPRPRARRRAARDRARPGGRPQAVRHHRAVVRRAARHGRPAAGLTR